MFSLDIIIFYIRPAENMRAIVGAIYLEGDVNGQTEAITSYITVSESVRVRHRQFSFECASYLPIPYQYHR